MTARRPGARRARLIVALVALTVLAVIAVPTAAWANHAVTWGVGAPDGPRQAEVDGPTDFGVSVSLDGQPLAGWPMLARVSRDGEVTEEIEFATDGSGLGAPSQSTRCPARTRT